MVNKTAASHSHINRRRASGERFGELQGHFAYTAVHDIPIKSGEKRDFFKDLDRIGTFLPVKYTQNEPATLQNPKDQTETRFGTQ